MTSDSSEKVEVAPEGETPPKPDASQLDFETLQKLRKAGFAKPEGVPWSHWLGLKKLSHRHHVIAMMAAVGKPPVEIAEYIGMTQSRLSLVLNCPRMQREVAKIRKEYFGENTSAEFMRMLPKATKFYDEMLDSENPKQAGIKFKVAQDLMNRALGKPKETLEIKNNSVRELYIFLDEMCAGSQKSIDFSSTRPQPQNQSQLDVIDATAKPVPTKRDEFAEIDAWVTKNVPRGSGLGKKD